LKDHPIMFSQLRRALGSGALFLGLSMLCWNLSPAVGQEPANPGPPPANPQGDNPQAANASSPRYGVTPDYITPQAHKPHRRRSIVHHYPYPYPGAYYNDDTAGFRNPGNVGRHAEYYLPGDRFQVEQDPVRVAQFNKGGYPSRSEQLAAE